jgi:fumarate reductase flavoprotein subunit
VDCHGGFEKVAAQTRSKLRNPNVNPHASHMGPEIACTVCHQGHTESRAYCVNCHTNFVMPMPEATARAQ